MSAKEPDREIRLSAADADAGERLDRWLAARIPSLSRARIQALIRDGQVASGATIREARAPVKPGAEYVLTLPPAEEPGVAGEAIALNVVYEDDDVIVIDKPAGLVVHPAAGHASGTLVNALIAHCGESLSGIGGIKRPGIVHRLDKETSGLLVVAKNDAAHQSLSEQFKSHGRDGRLERQYLALIWGAPTRRTGTIDLPLARSSANRTKITVVRAGLGREAITHYDVLETFPGATPSSGVSLLAVTLETGRTHQIRVHLAHTGHPILGDQTYGAGFKTRAAALPEKAQKALTSLGRQALHAAVLGFEHPRTGKSLRFESPAPPPFAQLLSALKAPRPREKARR